MSCLFDAKDAVILPHWDYTAPDGAYFNLMDMKDAGTIVPQHSHTEAHTTLLVRGKIRAWRDGAELGDYTAPAAIFIPACIKHTFQSLEPDTQAWCVFAKAPVLHEEHQIVRAA